MDEEPKNLEFEHSPSVSATSVYPEGSAKTRRQSDRKRKRIPNHPLASGAGIFKNDPLWEEVIKSIEASRLEMANSDPPLLNREE